MRRRSIAPGKYRNITGNEAIALGFVAAAQLAGLRALLGSYPITPASDILHELSKHKNFGVHHFQAEDEIAAIGAAIGAAFGGELGVTATCGPGIALKAEAIGLARQPELPLVIINVQRGGPSTGLPTKTEQADLLQAVYGRNGECPLPVVAAARPARLLRRGDRGRAHRRQVHDPGHPALRRLPRQRRRSRGCIPTSTALPEDRGDVPRPNPNGLPASTTRDPETLARPWAMPGTPGLEHRIGGIEKADVTGNVSPTTR